METEIIEHNPILIEYIRISNTIPTFFDDFLKTFYSRRYYFSSSKTAVESGEWPYVMSIMEQNTFLLKRLDKLGLLKSEVSICDAGIGLGSALFDLYLQSKEMTDKKFIFSGIEKCQKYIDFFNEKLSRFWNGDLNYIVGDIMEQDYSEYDIIYTYSPFFSQKDLLIYYTKLKDDIKPGSLIIENRERGLGLNSILTMVGDLERISIDDIYIFKKL